MDIHFNGIWKNQNNSRLVLKVTNGIVTGRFESGVGDDDQVHWVDIQGRVFNSLIAFNAVYPEYQSIVSWVGQYSFERNKAMIKTFWLYTNESSNNNEHNLSWYSNRIGADVFTKI